MMLAAAAAYVSLGFVSIPDSVKLGAMSAVAVDARNGYTYVLHRGEKPLVAFDNKGKYLRSWGEGMFKVAHGLRVDREGNVWTTDNGNHLLRKFSPDGKLLATINEGFRAPDDMVFAKDGSIYVADSGNGRIVRLTPEGKMISSFGKKGKGEGEFATAHGLAIDGQDHVYVADRGNQRVQVFAPDGRFLAAWSGFGNPFGMLVHGKELIVSEGDKNQIFHLSLLDGKVVRSWGDNSVLQLPHIMSVDKKGRLFVAEVNGKRVQIFKRP
jgi:sugar lactone lactonase YvrE